MPASALLAGTPHASSRAPVAPTLGSRWIRSEVWASVIHNSLRPCFEFAGRTRRSPDKRRSRRGGRSAIPTVTSCFAYYFSLTDNGGRLLLNRTNCGYDSFKKVKHY